MEEIKTLQVPLEKGFSNKKNCMKKAQEILDKGLITGMTQKQLAQEIFAHAMCFQMATVAEKMGFKNKEFDYLLLHADPVDLCDNGDTRERREIYTLIWDSVL